METGILAARGAARRAATPRPTTRPCARDYEAHLRALKPRFDLYEKANRVNVHPWLADLVIWRAKKSPRLLRAHERRARRDQQPGQPDQRARHRAPVHADPLTASPATSPMCQLLGMNANTPTDVMFSFTGLATRADEHKDGFGIAFFEDRGVRCFVDHHSARESPVAELVKRYPIKSDNVDRPHPQGHAGPGGAGEHPPVRARALGPLLGVRAQRRPERLRAAPARRASARSATPTASAPSAG